MRRPPTIAAKLTSASVLPMGREMGRMKKCLKTAAALATLAAVFCILLAGCGEEKPILIIPTPAQTPSFSPTQTITKIPSNTVNLHPTLKPTFTIDQTMAFLATEGAALSTQIAPFGDTCEEYYILMHMSPDGKWTFCDGYKAINVINQQGQKWIFSYEKDFGSGISPDFTNLIHWSVNEHYLYFAPMIGLDGVYPFPYNGLALYRMDLSSGDVQTVLPSHLKSIDLADLYTLSISPTGRRLAFIYEKSFVDPVDIVIMDLRTGEKNFIHLGTTYFEVGWFSWSRDGTEFSFTVIGLKGSKNYELTYDVATLQLIRSKVINP
jgi:hypothetical protein